MTQKQMITDVFYIQPTLEESKSGQVKFKGVFQRADVLNENGRVYPKRVLEKAINEFVEKVKSGRAVGTLEHPADGKTKAYEISHRITNIEINDKGEVLGEAIVLDTTKGRELKALLEGGVAIGISSRGFGTVKSVNRDGRTIQEVQEDYELETFDVVYDPSTPGAFVGMTESKQGEDKMQIEKIKQEYEAKIKALEEAKNKEMKEKLEDFAQKLIESIPKDIDIKAMLAVEAVIGVLKPLLPELSEMKQAEAEVALEEAKEKIKQMEEKINELEIEKYKLEKIAESHEPEKLKEYLSECKTKEEIDAKVEEFKKKKIVEGRETQKQPIDESSLRRKRIFSRLAGKTNL